MPISESYLDLTFKIYFLLLASPYTLCLNSKIVSALDEIYLNNIASLLKLGTIVNLIASRCFKIEYVADMYVNVIISHIKT